MNRNRIRIRKLDDFISGVLFALLGTGSLFVAIDYPMGTTTRMGPGYLPAVLSVILLVLGLLIMLQSISFREASDGAVAAEPSEERWQWLALLRPMFFIGLALTSFGFLLPRIGLFFAVITLVLICSFADYRNHFLLAIPLSVILAFTVMLIFVNGLGIPIRVWPW